MDLKHGDAPTLDHAAGIDSFKNILYCALVATGIIHLSLVQSCRYGAGSLLTCLYISSVADLFIIIPQTNTVYRTVKL